MTPKNMCFIFIFAVWSSLGAMQSSAGNSSGDLSLSTVASTDYFEASDSAVGELLSIFAAHKYSVINRYLKQYSVFGLVALLNKLVALPVAQSLIDFVFIALCQEITTPQFLHFYEGQNLVLSAPYDVKLKGILLMQNMRKTRFFKSKQKMEALALLNNNTILMRTLNGVLLIGDLAAHRALVLSESDKENIKFTAISRDSSIVAVCSVDGNIRWWNTNRGETGYLKKEVDKVVTSLALSPDGRQVMIGFESGEVLILDLVTRNCIRMFKSDLGVVTALAMSLDGRTVFSGGERSAMAMWDMVTGSGKCICPARLRTAAVSALRVTSDGRYVLMYFGDGYVQNIDITNATSLTLSKKMATKMGLVTTVGDACFVANSVLNKKMLTLLHIDTGDAICAVPFLCAEADSLVAANERGVLLTANDDGTLFTLCECELPAADQLSLTQLLWALKVKSGLVAFRPEDQSSAGCLARTYGIVGPRTLDTKPHLQALYESLPFETREYIEHVFPRAFSVGAGEVEPGVRAQEEQLPIDDFNPQIFCESLTD